MEKASRPKSAQSPVRNSAPFFKRDGEGFFKASAPSVTPATTTVMRQEGSASPRVRIPSLEIAGMQYGNLGRDRYPLSADQLAVGREVFGNSIVYSAVRIVESSIIAAPTTLGNNIRIPPNSSLDNSTLIHELMHIWQFQNHGTGYISNSLVHQLAGILGTGDRNAAYTYTIVPGQSILGYTAEQQAMIVEDYYRQPTKRVDPEFQRMIEEVRSASPTVLTDIDRYSEALYGPSYQNPNLFNLPSPGGGMDRGGGTAPLLRIEF